MASFFNIQHQQYPNPKSGSTEYGSPPKKKLRSEDKYTHQTDMPPFEQGQNFPVADRLQTLSRTRITSLQENKNDKLRTFDTIIPPHQPQALPFLPPLLRLDTNKAVDVSPSNQPSYITLQLPPIAELLEKEFQTSDRRTTQSFPDKPASSSSSKGLKDLSNAVKKFSLEQNWTKALETIDEMIRDYPNNLSVYFFSCNFLMRLKQYEKVLSVSEKFLEYFPSSLIPLMYSSLALRHLGRWKESVNKAKILLHDTTCHLLLNPKDAEALSLKSKALSLLGEFEKSLHCANKVLNLDSAHFLALKCKIEVLQALGEWKESLKTANAALEMYSFNIEILDLNATNLHLLGRWDELLITADMLLNDNNSNVEALKYRAIALLNLGEFALSLIASEEALLLSPDDVNASFIKADALDKLGQHTESNKIYHAILNTTHET